jgi:MFS family permease
MTAAIFYLGFIIGAYPAMMLAQRYPIERVACGVVTLWGICLILTTVCHDYRGIYTQRFFLGLLESGISPMFMLIVVRGDPSHFPLELRNLTPHPSNREVGTRRTNRQ